MKTPVTDVVSFQWLCAWSEEPGIFCGARVRGCGRSVASGIDSAACSSILEAQAMGLIPETVGKATGPHPRQKGTKPDDRTEHAELTCLVQRPQLWSKELFHLRHDWTGAQNAGKVIWHPSPSRDPHDPTTRHCFPGHLLNPSVRVASAHRWRFNLTVYGKVLSRRTGGHAPPQQLKDLPDAPVMDSKDQGEAENACQV